MFPVMVTQQIYGNKHIEKTAELCKKLNDYNFKYLHYKNSIGTDLIVELPEDHIWMGGAEKSQVNYYLSQICPQKKYLLHLKKTA